MINQVLTNLDAGKERTMSNNPVKIIILIISLFSTVFIGATEQKYKFVSEMDISGMEGAVKQMYVDDLSFLYLRTQNKLYLYDCHADAICKLIDTIEFKTPEDSLFLINDNCEIFSAKIDEVPVQIFDEHGALKLALGEMKTNEERYQTVKQILLDSRGYFILATPGKILYFDKQGNFDHLIKIKNDYKIIQLDDKNDLYVLQLAKFTHKQAEELSWLEDNLKDIKDKLDSVEVEIDEIFLEKSEISIKIDKLEAEGLEVIQAAINSPSIRIKLEWRKDKDIDEIKSDRRKLKYKRKIFSKIDSFKARRLRDVSEELLELEIEERKLHIKFKEKQLESLKLLTEAKERRLEKNEVLDEASSKNKTVTYGISIYNSWGELSYSFILPNPQNALPLYNTYLVKSDSRNNFFGVPASKTLDKFEILNPANEAKRIKSGVGKQVNIYSNSGEYLQKVEADPPFDGINYITIDKKGNLYVLDANFIRLRKFRSAD